MATADFVPKRTHAEVNDVLSNTPGSAWETERGVVFGKMYPFYKRVPICGPRDLWERAQQWPDREFLVYEEERYTFKQCDVIIDKIAHGLLREFGLKKGDKVAFAVRNTSEWVLVYWACHKIGLVPACVNCWISPAHMAHCIRLSDAKLLFADGARLDELRAELGNCPDIQGILLCRYDAHAAQVVAEHKTVRYDRLIADSPSTPFPRQELLPTDDCIMIFTSGTTGFPKGVLGTNLQFGTAVLNQLLGFAIVMLRRGEALPDPYAVGTVGPQKVMLMPAPLFHVAGATCQLPLTCFMGAKLCLMYKWDVKKAIEIIKRDNVTHIGGVPFLLRTALDAGVNRANWPSLESVSYGGAPSPPALIQDFAKTFPGIGAQTSYGCSEAFGILGTHGDGDFVLRPTACARPAPVTEIRIVNPETEREVPVNVDGEIWVRGMAMAREYIKMPEETAKAWTIDGWYKSGDIGHLDEEGFLYISDRKKDIIIRGGENIASLDVEAAIAKNPAVSESCAVAIPHRSLGEEIALVVVPRPGFKLTEEDIHKTAEQNLKPMWRPRFVMIVDEVERNANGKQDKKIVRAMAAKAWEERQAAAQPKL